MLNVEEDQKLVYRRVRGGTQRRYIIYWDGAVL